MALHLSPLCSSSRRSSRACGSTSPRPLKISSLDLSFREAPGGALAEAPLLGRGVRVTPRESAAQRQVQAPSADICSVPASHSSKSSFPSALSSLASSLARDVCIDVGLRALLRSMPRRRQCVRKPRLRFCIDSSHHFWLRNSHRSSFLPHC